MSSRINKHYRNFLQQIYKSNKLLGEQIKKNNINTNNPITQKDKKYEPPKIYHKDLVTEYNRKHQPKEERPHKTVVFKKTKIFPTKSDINLYNSVQSQLAKRLINCNNVEKNSKLVKPHNIKTFYETEYSKDKITRLIQGEYTETNNFYLDTDHSTKKVFKRSHTPTFKRLFHIGDSMEEDDSGANTNYTTVSSNIVYYFKNTKKHFTASRDSWFLLSDNQEKYNDYSHRLIPEKPNEFDFKYWVYSIKSNMKTEENKKEQLAKV